MNVAILSCKICLSWSTRLHACSQASLQFGLHSSERRGHFHLDPVLVQCAAAPERRFQVDRRSYDRPFDGQGDGRRGVDSRTARVSDVSPVRILAILRLLRMEEGGAGNFTDLLEGGGRREAAQEAANVAEAVHRTFGFRMEALPDARDKRQATDLVGGVVRWKRFLDVVISKYYEGPRWKLERMEPLLGQILRLGVFEMLKLNRPAYAVINELVELAKVALRPGAGSLVNAILRRVGDAQSSAENGGPPLLASAPPGADDRARARALGDLHSHPVWLVRRWMARFGEADAVKLMEWDNSRPYFCLRANTLKGMTREALSEALTLLEVPHSESALLETFVRVESGMQAVLGAGLVADGKCSVQDESAGLVVHLLDPQPGEFIIDCCAAPGGKALFAAALMDGQGRLLATDVSKGRLALLQKVASNAGVGEEEGGPLRLRVADVRDLAADPELQGAADRVLLDSPCSGLGVMAKRADLRWRVSPEALGRLTALQDELLDAAARLVRPGGLLVYSTCSIEEEENEERVEAFLRTHPDFQVESAEGLVPSQMLTRLGCVATLPHRDGIDGAFGARLRRSLVS
eukprot:TRINITY_DN16920_c0_g1_i1.p1 TRINITY_DN16920_c0_g1~~TRINITY_DN16920_c0_g1_i1.p1  ORF type:complete len:579 (-),score=115.57 TRINITY_DN16920_c0_g1_i1:276-2012(-)